MLFGPVVFEGEACETFVDSFGVVGEGHVHVDALEFGGVMFEYADLGGDAVFGHHHGEVGLEVAHAVGIPFVWLEVSDGVCEQVASYGIVFVGGAFPASSCLLSFHREII